MHKYPLILSALVYCGLTPAFAASASAADWPAWGYNPARGAASPTELPATLHLHWQRENPAPQPAWEEDIGLNPGLQFDHGYTPIVVNGLLIYGSSANDSVTALDAATGDIRWRYYTGGPVRFAPSLLGNRLYVVSDDGYLYCLDVNSGELYWLFRGAPGPHLALGNDRLISLWPARGAPVTADGIVYFAAGIWPFMGISVYALDAETGRIRWQNDGVGAIPTRQPHGGQVLAALAPQGYLALSGDTLLVPNSRSLPAALDRHTGAFRYLDMAAIRSGKGIGGYAFAAARHYLFNSGYAFDLETGESVMRYGLHGVWQGVVADDTVLYAPARGELTSFNIAERAPSTEEVDGRGRSIRVFQRPQENWVFNMGASYRLFLKAGNRLYLGRSGGIAVLELSPDGDEPVFAWHHDIDGRPESMAAGAGMLFVGTREGMLYAFGAGETETRIHTQTNITKTVSMPVSETARRMLEHAALPQGYVLVLGLASGELPVALATESELDIIVIDPDPEKIARFRRDTDRLGLYGKRIHALTGTIDSLRLPPYLASLVVSETPVPAGMKDADAFADALCRVLRPYGATAILDLPQAARKALSAHLDQRDDDGYHLRTGNDGDELLLTRQGPPPGAAPWTHAFGDAANTVVSRDRAVRSPMGVLWFGGPLNPKQTLPVQVAGGRQFILRRHSLRAFDVYTGRMLWETTLPGLGPEHNNHYLALNNPWDERPSYANTIRGYIHQSGAIAYPASYVSLSDAIYVAYGKHCLRIDPENGAIAATFSLPAENDGSEPPDWGFIRVSGDVMVTTAASTDASGATASRAGNIPAARRLFALDRHTGAVRWRHASEYSIGFEALALSADTVYLIDMPDSVQRAEQERRGATRDDTPRLIALDLKNGQPRWSTSQDVFGTWLGYSKDHDLLVQAFGREEGRRISVLRGTDGTPVWDRPLSHRGPLMIHGESLINQRSGPASTGRASYNLLTGDSLTIPHPLTGRNIEWQYRRFYGCGPATASEHLLLFRSAAAGYYDLTRRDGTGNFGGFRSGCTQNLTAAEGVLNAPDMTEGCNCTFHHQTSLALVHRPELDAWHHADPDTEMHRDADTRLARMREIQRIGVNLGAPGVRRDDTDTYWINYPETLAAPTPPITVETPETPQWFFRHSLRINDGALPWVSASGIMGEARLNIPLIAPDRADRERTGTVTLYFAEPEEHVMTGERVFDVRIQDRERLSAFDIVRETGGHYREISRTFREVPLMDALTIELTAAGDLPPVLSGIEIILQRNEADPE